MPSNIAYKREEDRHIRTLSGRKFFLKSEDVTAIHLADITASLSNMCRFTGQVQRFYSVAEHSILVAALVSRMTTDPMKILQALMHDSTEAYLADISSPFKGALLNYKEYEDSIWSRIARKYDIEPVLCEEVHFADWVALFAEATVLQPNSSVFLWDRHDDYGIYAYWVIDTLGLPALTHRQAEDKLFRLVNKYLLKCGLQTYTGE